MKIIGWDPGRMYDKGYSVSSGKEIKTLAVNAVCMGYKLKNLEVKDDVEDLSSLLDVEIYEDLQCVGRFFVGDLAYRSNRGDLIISSNNISKFSKEMMLYDKVRMLTHIAYSNYLSDEKDECVKCRIGTGVPTDEYFDDNNNLDIFRQEICRRYTVKFMQEQFNNYATNIEIESLNFKPEGTSTAINTKFTIDMKLDIESNKYVKDQLGDEYLILNLGSSTIDAAILKNGEFIPIGFFGLEIGSSTVLNHIINDLDEICGYRPDKVTMDYLLMHTDHISYKGCEINIAEIAKPRYANLLMQIKVALLNKLELKNISFKNLTGVYLAGGLVKMISDYNHELLKEFLPIKTVISNDPIYDEAKGYHLSALAEYKKKEAAKEATMGIESTRADDKKVIKVG
ncbi:MAG: hypothetical protein WBA54_13565 [Acidaminobacteraceae bacterium]